MKEYPCLELECLGISELDAAIQVCHARKYHPSLKTVLSFSSSVDDMNILYSVF